MAKQISPETIEKHSVCFASFSFWSRSCPYILDSLVVPIRSDQDNKVETCLLKQSNSLLSRPTQTMNRNLTRKAGAWTDLLPKGWMLSFWTAFHHHHILMKPFSCEYGGQNARPNANLVLRRRKQTSKRSPWACHCWFHEAGPGDNHHHCDQESREDDENDLVFSF